MTPLVIGIDIGTGGARAVVTDAEGKVLFSASHLSPPPFMDSTGVSEQVADAWEIAALSALGRCLKGLRQAGGDARSVEAIGVDGTSGTIVLLDADHRPLYPGLMHNDTRAFAEAARLNDLLDEHCRETGYRFGASFALSKILWLKDHRPLLFERAARIAHQADFIIGRLTGNYGTSDPSNALKTGYNLITDRWPEEFEEWGLAPLLPRVIPSGSPVGQIRPEVAEEFGLREDALVLAGVTDSTAAFLATGASQPGEFCVSLGTTMAFKGISETLVHDPEGAVYCHRHPGGCWLPGGASNVGGACLNRFFPNRTLSELDGQVAGLFPTRTLCYPLVEVGERFPFQSPDANGFFEPAENEEDQYLSLLQGVALVEKWCFERFERLGVKVVPPVYSAGGGSRSDAWCQIRSNVLQRPLVRCRSTDSAFGAAVLAGAFVFCGGDLRAAAAKMTGVEKEFQPDLGYRDWGEEQLEELKRRCVQRGWAAPGG